DRSLASCAQSNLRRGRCHHPGSGGADGRLAPHRLRRAALALLPRLRRGVEEPTLARHCVATLAARQLSAEGCASVTPISRPSGCVSNLHYLKTRGRLNSKWASCNKIQRGCPRAIDPLFRPPRRENEMNITSLLPASAFNSIAHATDGTEPTELTEASADHTE